MFSFPSNDCLQIVIRIWLGAIFAHFLHKARTVGAHLFCTGETWGRICKIHNMGRRTSSVWNCFMAGSAACSHAVLHSLFISRQNQARRLISAGLTSRFPANFRQTRWRFTSHCALNSFAAVFSCSCCLKGSQIRWR